MLEKALGFLILGAAGWWFLSGEPSEIQMYSHSSVNIREQPSLTSKIVRTTSLGEIFTIDTEQLQGELGWFQLGHSEFVATSVLRKYPPQKTSVAKASTNIQPEQLATPPPNSPVIPEYEVEHFGTQYLISTSELSPSVVDIVTLTVFPKGRFPASTVYVRAHIDCEKSLYRTIGEGHGTEPNSIEAWDEPSQRWDTLFTGSTKSNTHRFVCSK